MVFKFLGAVLLAASTGAALPAQTAPLVIEGPPGSQELGERAWQALQAACPRLRQAEPDIERVRIQVRQTEGERDLGSYAARTNRWTRMLDVDVALRSRVTTIPVTDDVRPGGEHAHFSLGGRPRPGISLNKRISRWLCNLPTASSDTTFRPVEEMSFITP